MPAEQGEGVRPRLAGCKLGVFKMTLINRAFALGRSLLADEVGTSSTKLALMIGLSASAVLVLVRVGTAVAAGLH